MQTEQHIAKADVVIAAIGQWPSFHDAEVLAFSLDRGSATEPASPTAKIDVAWRQYEPRGEGTSAYRLELVRSAVISLQFSGVSELDVGGFNQQNVIDSIEVTPLREDDFDGLLVTVDPIFGFGGLWRCQVAEVAGVRSLFPPQG